MRPLAEVEARLKDIELTWTSGQWTRDAMQRLMAKHGVKERQLLADKARVVAHYRQTLEPLFKDQVEAKLDVLGRARLLFAESLKRGHTATCARLLDFEARVTGAMEPVKLDITHRSVDDMSEVELARQILDPEARSWAVRVLEEAGEALPQIIELREVPNAK